MGSTLDKIQQGFSAPDGYVSERRDNDSEDEMEEESKMTEHYQLLDDDFWQAEEHDRQARMKRLEKKAKLDEMAITTRIDKDPKAKGCIEVIDRKSWLPKYLRKSDEQEFHYGSLNLNETEITKGKLCAAQKDGSEKKNN